MPPNTTVAPRALRRGADFVAAQRVAGVNADADDVAGLDGRQIERLERFVDNLRDCHMSRASPPPGRTASAA